MKVALEATCEMEQTEHLADLVRRDHPSLRALPLHPDGKYQRRPVTAAHLTGAVQECLADAFRGRAPEDFPRLYCAWGKARVGSTALNNMFGLAGFPSYYQPVKSMLRTAFAGEQPEPWRAA